MVVIYNVKISTIRINYEQRCALNIVWRTLDDIRGMQCDPTSLTGQLFSKRKFAENEINSILFTSSLEKHVFST